MNLTNCNCGEKVECGCGTLSFDYYNDITTSVLEVGNLVSSTGCILEEYVIDWYKDGSHYFVTGKGLDTEIQAYHPMTGSTAVPVIGGTWIPVLRYFVISGVQIFPVPKSCNNWCDVIVDLPTITIQSLNCGISNTTGAYQYRIIYSSNDPNSLPSRTILWELPSDQSILNFAIRFYPYNVADKIEVFFNSESNLLAAWITGFDTSTNYSLTPPVFRPSSSTAPLSFVIALPAYQAGDFLIIKITPSVLTPTITQTDWIVDFKCLDSSVSFNCDLLTLSRRGYNVLDYQWVDNPSACSWEMTVPLITPFPNFTNSASPYYPFALYAGMSYGGFNQGFTSTMGVAPQRIGIRFQYSKNAILEMFNMSGYNIRTASVDNMNLVKSGNVFTWTFTSQTDYDTAYSNYQASIASPWYTNYINDPTNIYYYRFWTWYWKMRPANCGDNATSTNRRLTFHVSSSIVFDSGSKTVTITSATVTNQYSTETCNTVVSGMDSQIRVVNSTNNAADYNENSLCFEWKMFGQGWGVTGSTFSFGKDRSGGYVVHLRGDNNPCIATFQGLCTSNSAWYFYIFYWRVIIDLELDPVTGDFPKDEFGQYIDHPWENFSVYENIDTTTNCSTNTTNNLALRVVNGIITYPI